MELVLHQKQTLQLAMTPELQQAISLLRYSTYELYQFIQDQYHENPLIELMEYDQSHSSHTSSKQVNYQASDAPHPIDFLTNGEKNMYENLLEQAKWLEMNEQERKVLEYLILNLDEHAYLPVGIDELATRLSIPSSEVEKGIQHLQSLEPVGVGARDVSECLALQLKYYYPDEQLTVTVVQNHLDLLARKKWSDLSKIYDLTTTDLKNMYDLIYSLDPQPNQSLNNHQADYIHPDIIIKENNGKFEIYLNDSYIPEVHFNSDYLPFMNKKDDVSGYLHNHFKQYQWLMNSIEQRRTTILKITEVVVRKQHGFFQKGFSALQPLTLDEVAQEIGMHESTVSRATTNKFIQTPKGTFDMRKLFSSKMNRNNGTVTSQTKVKWLLKELIEKENKEKPLSDQKIADYFADNQQIKISRRTVAKYREEMHIESSRQRKELSV